MLRQTAFCKCWLQVPTARLVLGHTVNNTFLNEARQQEVFTGHVLGRRRNWRALTAGTLMCCHVHGRKHARGPCGCHTMTVSLSQLAVLKGQASVCWQDQVGA